MTARTAKQNVDDPAARPSSPSVRLTAFALATTTNEAKITHTAGPTCHPGRLYLVKEIAVVAPAHFHAASAKPTATRTCAANFVRLLRPRLRALRTPMRSSAKPM